MSNVTTLFGLHRAKIVAAGLLALLSAWLLWPREESAAARYRSEAVTRGDLVITVSATGNVQPTNQIDVGSEQSGTVAAVLVDDNDRVSRDQVLARLDTSRLENAVTRARAALQSAQANVRVAEATVHESKANLDRLRRIRATSAGGLISDSDFDAAEAALARANANESAARATVAQARAALDSADTDLSKAIIVSPIDGIVLARSIAPGQTVAASFQAPVLFTLAEDLTRMELEVAVDEADVGRIQSGQPASFTVDAWPDREYAAEVVRVRYGSQITEGVVSYLATLSVDNADLSLRPGMTATATITTLRQSDVLRVPNAALRFSPPDAGNATSATSFVSRLLPRPPRQARAPATKGGKGSKQQVHVLVNGQPQALPVTVGDSDGRLTALTGSELHEGDMVIVEYLGASP